MGFCSCAFPPAAEAAGLGAGRDDIGAVSVNADGWDELLLPEIEGLKALGIEVAFRGDAAFARPSFTRRWKSGR